MVALPMTWSVSVATPRRLTRFSGVAMASASANVESVKVAKGLGDLPKVTLTSVHGSEAELYLYGGCVTSWKVASKDLLFVRPDAVFTGQKPISGGIPHCFPQFGPGAIQQHGFARNMNWSVVSSETVEGNPTVILELKDGPYSRSMWDYSFHALYKVTLDSNTLSTELKVINTDEKPFSFTTALHTYFSASVTGASVKGLKGCKTLNKDPDPKNPVEGTEAREAVTFPGFVDCVYLEAPAELQLNNGLGGVITIKNTNWSDAVLWNPHLTMESCYKDFVCVENAKVLDMSAFHLSPRRRIMLPKDSTQKGKLMKFVRNGVGLSKILLTDDDGKFVRLERSSSGIEGLKINYFFTFILYDIDE